MTNVLFLCTGNTARSVLSEAILRQDGAGRFMAYSAGSQPKGVVNPFALKVLERMGYPATGFSSKSWNVFSVPGAPKMDYIITVCDNAAGEACPIWPGHPASAHWGIEDPAAVTGADEAIEAAFETAFHQMKARIAAFLALPFDSLDEAALRAEMRKIGQMDGASAGAA